MLARQEEAKRFDLAATTPLELIRNKIETERLEIIPLSKVLTEHALIDDSHAEELGVSMRQKRGQITPIAVRARLDDGTGDVVYDVIDGFHRTEGKKKSGDAEINATVIYGCSDEEMYDLRILAASSVRSVQFARIAQWITNSFATTPWAEKGLSISQTFGIAMNSTSRSSYLAKLDRQELEDLRSWVNAKCKRWGRAPSSIYSLLKVVASADPGLVKEVRTAAGGSSREVTITQAKLDLVVNAYPGDEKFAVQRAILHYAVENRLKIGEVGIIVQEIQGKVKPGMSENKIKNLARAVKIERQIAPASKTIEVNEEEEDDEPELELDGDDSGDWWDKLEPSDEDIQEAEESTQDRSESTVFSKDVEMRRNGRYKRSTTAKSIGTVAGVSAFARGEGENIAGLRERIRDLEQALEAATSNKGRKTMETWWRSAPYLTPTERICMERGFYENEDLDTLAQELRIPEQRVVVLMRSAFSKRNFLDLTRKS